MERTIAVTGISDELLSQLDERARQIGVDRDSYVRRLLERAVAPPDAWTRLSELLAPVHDSTEARRIPENDIEQLLSGQVAERRREHGRPDQGGQRSR